LAGNSGQEAGVGVWGAGGRDCTPVVVWVVGIVAALNPLKPVAQLLLIQLEIPNHACLPVQVKSQHGQTGSRTGFSKPKDVKLPVGLSILQNMLSWLSRRHLCRRMLLSKRASSVVIADMQCSSFVCVCKHTLLAACEWKSVNEGASD